MPLRLRDVADWLIIQKLYRSMPVRAQECLIVRAARLHQNLSLARELMARA